MQVVMCNTQVHGILMRPHGGPSYNTDKQMPNADVSGPAIAFRYMLTKMYFKLPQAHEIMNKFKDF